MTLTLGFKMDELINKLSAIFQKEETHLITYKEMQELDDFDKLNLGPGIVSRKMPTYDPNLLLFYVTFKKGAVLQSHQHDCKELIAILKGRIETGKEFSKAENEKIVFYPFVPHKLTATEESTLLVYFFKPLKRTFQLSTLVGF